LLLSGVDQKEYALGRHEPFRDAKSLKTIYFRCHGTDRDTHVGLFGQPATNEYSDEGMYGTFWNILLLLLNKDKDEYAFLIHCILFIQGGTHDRRQKYFSIEVRQSERR